VNERRLNLEELNAINQMLKDLKMSALDLNKGEDYGRLLDFGDGPIFLPKGPLEYTNRLKQKIVPQVSGANSQIRVQHTMSPEYVLPMLENKRLFLRPVTQQISDKLEYVQAHVAVFEFKPLQRLAKPINGKYNSASVHGDDLYIFCMSMADEYDAVQFMNAYGRKDHDAVRIDLDICLREATPGTGINGALAPGGHSPNITLGRVIYDDGKLFDEFKDLYYALFSFGIETKPIGFPGIAPFLKRTRYSWEQEMRLVVNVRSNVEYIVNDPTQYENRVAEHMEFISRKYKCEFTDNPRGVRFAFDTPFAEIRPVRVLIGRNVPDGEATDIVEYCSRVGLVCSRQ